MWFLVASLGKDLSRWRRDLPALLLWLAVPLVIGTLVTTLMDAGGGAKPRGTLLVADLDDSLPSNAVGAAFGQGELAELVDVESVSVEAGRARIDAGDASAFLVIPAGFGDALLSQEQVTLTLVTNPSQTILPGIIEDVLAVLLDGGFYLQQLFADEIAVMTQSTASPSDAEVAELAVAINRKLANAGSQLFPPAFDVEIVETTAAEPGASVSLLYLPGVLLMAIVFFANGFAADIWTERRQGTLRRLASVPSQLAIFLAGKTLAAGVFFAAVGVVTLLVGFAYHGIPVEKFPPMLVIVTLSGMGFFAWFVLLQMLASTSRGANLLTTLALFPLLMLGGSFFPLAAMPDGLRLLGRLTPNGYIVENMTTELTGSGAWLIATPGWAVVLAMLLSGLLLASWRLHGSFARN